MIITADITYNTLSNGLKCVHIPVHASAVEHVGVVVNTGSRNDPEGYEGLAHFVEHTIFKGTSRRKSWHIINRMEACGGELNAYTTKENTVVYTIFPTGNFDRAADLISDLVCDSQFPCKELEKEREVVADEISSYLDIPSEAVFDDFEDLMFRGSPLGHNILGRQDALARFDTEACQSYLKRHYVADNMVLYYAGCMPADKVWRRFERYFSGLPKGGARIVNGELPVVERFSEYRDLGIHQAHTVVGARIPDMYSEKRYAMALLVNVLGGPGMNSLLNVALRERRGLVYSVEANATMLSDTGLFSVYYGCDSQDVDRCMSILYRTISDLCDSTMSDVRLRQAKRQYLGQLAVASENSESMVISMARSVLYRGHVLSDSMIRKAIEDISAADICEAAMLIRPDRLSSLTMR